MRTSIVVAFAAVYVAWGSTYAAIAVAVETLPPFLMAGLRWLLAGAVVAALAFRAGPFPSRSELVSAAIGGLLLLALGNGLVCWAELRVSSSVAALIVASAPVFTVLLEWLCFRQRAPQPRVWVGVLAGVAGVVVLVGPLGSTDTFGVAAMLLAALCWSVGSLYARYRSSAKGLRGAALQMLAGGFGMALIGLVRGETLGTPSASSWAAFAYLVVVGSLIGFGAYLWLVPRVRPGLLATHSFVNPLIAVFVGATLLGETVTAATWIASALIVSAVVLMMELRPRLREAESHSLDQSAHSLETSIEFRGREERRIEREHPVGKDAEAEREHQADVKRDAEGEPDFTDAEAVEPATQPPWALARTPVPER